MTSGSFNRRRFLGAAAPAAVGAWALASAPGAGAVEPDHFGLLLNIKDFGAVGNGVANDAPALQAGLDALAAAGGGRLLIPDGRFLIASPVAKSFQNLASSVVIHGRGSSSQLIIKLNGSVNGLTLSNLTSAVVENLTFVGTPGVTTDARQTLRFENCLYQALVMRCDFYGLASAVNGGGVVGAYQSDLRVVRSAFLGCTGNSAVNAPVLQNDDWLGLSVIDTDFIDFGTLNGVEFSKTNLAPASSWVTVNNPKALGANGQNTVVLRGVRMDEGAQWGFTCRPNVPSAPRVANVVISNLVLNASSIGGARGIYVQHADHVRIEHSWIGFASAVRPAVQLVNVADGVIDACRFEAGANVIEADLSTVSLTVRESVYTTLDSDAQRTTVVKAGVEAAVFKAAGAIAVNSLVRWSPGNANRVEVAPAGSDASGVVGVSLDAGIAGGGVRVARTQAANLTVVSDGATDIEAGDGLGVSPTAAGRVRKVTSGAIVGRATAPVIASVGAAVPMTFFNGGFGGVSGAEAPKAAVLANGWKNYGNGFNGAAFYRDGSRVHLLGVITGGVAAPGTVITTLVAGYRPVGVGLFVAAAAAGPAQLRVHPNGDVVFHSGVVGAYLSLDGISFRVAG